MQRRYGTRRRLEPSFEAADNSMSLRHTRTPRTIFRSRCQSNVVTAHEDASNRPSKPMPKQRFYGARQAGLCCGTKGTKNARRRIACALPHATVAPLLDLRVLPRFRHDLTCGFTTIPARFDLRLHHDHATIRPAASPRSRHDQTCGFTTITARSDLRFRHDSGTIRPSVLPRSHHGYTTVRLPETCGKCDILGGRLVCARHTTDRSGKSVFESRDPG
jgi:hypothetical protein